MQAKSNTPKLNPTQCYLVARALDCSMRVFYNDSENKKAFEMLSILWQWAEKKEKK